MIMLEIIVMNNKYIDVQWHDLWIYVFAEQWTI